MNRLKDLREDRDLQQADIGKAIGTTAMSISRYEREESALTAELIHKFCDFYGVTADYLLGRSNQPKPAVSKSDTELLDAYGAAPPAIRQAVDGLLEPYRRRPQTEGGQAAAG